MKNYEKVGKKMCYQSEAKVKDSHFFVFISKLSLCDILYIILSCIQTISSNYKG